MSTSYTVNETSECVLVYEKGNKITGISFDVYGEPCSYASSRYNSGRKNGQTGWSYNPRSKQLTNFRKCLNMLFCLATDKPTFSEQCWLSVKVEFTFVRKKSHFLANDQLKASAPRYPPKKDLDNLVKFVLDGMTGPIYSNDKCIASLNASKVYGETSKTTVWVTLMH